jgi:hypothetical protein
VYNVDTAALVIESGRPGPSVEVRCDRCRRNGYEPATALGMVTWRAEAERWDLFVMRRTRDSPVAPRQARLIAHGPAKATLRCGRCGKAEDWRAATLGKRARAQGLTPAEREPFGVLYV